MGRERKMREGFLDLWTVLCKGTELWKSCRESSECFKVSRYPGNMVQRAPWGEGLCPSILFFFFF